jgi:hypothetical protein
MRFLAIGESGRTGEINLVSSGRSVVTRNGVSPATVGEKKQVFAENVSRLSFRIQNRSVTAVLVIWEGAIGAETELIRLQPGTVPDAGDLAICSSVKNRISLSSTGSETPYYAGETL